MSFLTPLYLLGALAVSLPILFHMIRRTPRDRREFSSTMFLQPSPPRMTRRSRIEHWLLLFLRALAVCLLALAFARPFLRQAQQHPLDAEDGSDLIVLLDISASMKREGLWDQAVAELQSILQDEVLPNDRFALLAFDEDLLTLCSFEQWSSLEHGQRSDAVLASIEELGPSWRQTDLGAALIEAAEQLDALSSTRHLAAQRRVVVISDLQSGSRLDALQTYDWPKGIGVDLRPVDRETSANNAAIQLVAEPARPAIGKEPRTRVRLINAEGADREEFTIRWVEEPGQQETAQHRDVDGVVSVIVPAGESRIIRAAPQEETDGMKRLLLEGDEHEFDNVCHVPPPRPRSATVAIVRGEDTEGPDGMSFYLPPALPSLPQRQIDVLQWEERGATIPHLTFVIGRPPAELLDGLREYVTNGGTIVFAAASAEEFSALGSLLNPAAEVDAATVSEAEGGEYVMLTGIDFDHPLFAALADPRYSDFTKVRFWKHRVLPEEIVSRGKALARFDNGDAAIVEWRSGTGRVIAFASGWHPDDSQLAISTKFVPMINGLVDDVAGIVERRTTYLVGEPVLLEQFDLRPADVRAVRTPRGEEITLPADAVAFEETGAPGIYEILITDSQAADAPAPSFAVNLAPAESRTAPLASDVLLASGVRLKPDDTTKLVDEAAQRQLRAGELESRQKLWRWLVVVVIAVLMLETMLAARAARRQWVSA
jgi:hypothetical protein